MDTCSNLNVDVDINSIFISLMKKLSKFAQAANNLPTATQAGTTSEENKENSVALKGGKDIFRLFKKYMDKIIEE